MNDKTHNFVIRMAAAIIVLALLLAVVSLLTGCNMAVIDTTYKFDRAIIYLPDGKTIEGKVDRWIDFDGSDMMQVQINGDWYLTHSANVLLIADDN